MTENLQLTFTDLVFRHSSFNSVLFLLHDYYVAMLRYPS